jgi:hypothetical protein
MRGSRNGQSRKHECDGNGKRAGFNGDPTQSLYACAPDPCSQAWAVQTPLEVGEPEHLPQNRPHGPVAGVCGRHLGHQHGGGNDEVLDAWMAGSNREARPNRKVPSGRSAIASCTRRSTSGPKKSRYAWSIPPSMKP